MTPDSELLANFARTNSEDAFAKLVKRHVNLVYSAALRQANGDEHLAKDVAQTVFTDLARKANSLSRRETLTGWLYTSAHFAAAKIVRGENRRRDREEKFMREPANDSGMGVPPVQSAPEPDWEKIRPTLDDAMHELKEADREAILLRYFENQPFIQVGAKLGLNENAARMRVERALEKLRGIFAKRGVTTATALASVISANAVQIVPANLVATLTTASIATAGTGTFTLLKIMTATKLKLGISALVFASVTMALMVQHQAQEKLRAQNEALTQELSQLQTDNQSFSNRLAVAGDSKKLPDVQFNELLKLRGEVGVLHRQVDELAKLREENREIRKAFADSIQSLPVTEQVLFNKQHIQTQNAAKFFNLAMRVYAADNNNFYPTNFNERFNKQLISSGKEMTNWSNTFEFMPGVASVELAEKFPNGIIFREKTARQAPDGKWERVYSFADGSAWHQTSADGNFDAFEQQHMIPAPNQ